MRSAEAIDARLSQRAAERIRACTLSLVAVPLRTPVSDAKVLNGRQRPMGEIAVVVAELTTTGGHEGMGFTYSTRAGGPAQYAHAKEVAQELIGEDPDDIGRIAEKLFWAGAAAGRSGIAAQAVAAIDIALHDLKARRAGISLAKMLGAHRESVPVYNTSGGYLNAPLGEVLDAVDRAIADGIGGIKLKVGHPDWRVDVERVAAVHDRIAGRAAMMVDVNQQWDRLRALRCGRELDRYGLAWIEEPLDAYDAAGHTALAAALDTPIATGEMLTSASELAHLVEVGGADVLQPDVARIGGVIRFQRVADLAERAGLVLAPHFVMELHVHLAAAYPGQTWVEHFDWLEPLFDERSVLSGGRMTVPAGPGLGLTLSERARAWTVESCAAD